MNDHNAMIKISKYNISSIILYNQLRVFKYFDILILFNSVSLKYILGGGEVIVYRDLSCVILHVTMISLLMSH